MKSVRFLFSMIADFFSVMDREGRGIEYHMSKVMFFMGLILILPENTLMLPTYQQIYGLGSSEMFAAVILCGFGGWRFLALYVNGFHFRTPRWRAAMSFCSCMFFGMLSYNVWFDYMSGVSVAPGFLLAIYPAFVIAEFRAASRLRWERIHYATH
ncbi:hypothetical protein [Falsirhodobacter sp. 20TX0035]|uniref:hypothetical protein n=1 Tax=Falsirhodobacter sp. 20TX0035 TaxID=3022019 RepID=UPI00232E2413|nr:hypothetical protein [Falsirhodobacter sp. 20TX0035]MDB6455221.1 hypothetical protein [Falsirhodobacter sp. 20TX0035]